MFGLPPLSDPAALLAALGPWVLVGVLVMVFIESGLLFPFLPGDSLLFTAALLHTQLGFSIWELLPIAMLAAIGGDQVGYLIGKKWGRRPFKPDAKILKTAYLERAEAFFEKHGVVAIVLARFVPIVRTYTPLAAGVSHMNHLRFTKWNVVGGVGWVALMTVAGLTLGSVPAVANHLDIAATVIVLVSISPIIISAIRSKLAARRAALDEVAVDPQP